MPFTNLEILANFEQDLIAFTKADIPMGLREAILDDVRKQGLAEGIEQGIEQGREQGREQGIEQGREQGIEQGIEIGEAKKEESLLHLTVPPLYSRGLSVEEIAAIYQVDIEKIESIIKQWEENQANDTSTLEEE